MFNLKAERDQYHQGSMVDGRIISRGSRSSAELRKASWNGSKEQLKLESIVTTHLWPLLTSTSTSMVRFLS